jgi:hypothetical protein
MNPRINLLIDAGDVGGRLTEPEDQIEEQSERRKGCTLQSGVFIPWADCNPGGS